MRSVGEIYTLGILPDEIDRTLDLILQGKSLPNLYVILLGSKKEEELVVYPSWMLRNISLRDAVVVGFADGREQAYSLVESIVDDVYQMNGDIDLKEYFKDR